MALKDYYNLYEGESIFIIGNGPSLNNTPLEKLNNEFTIAMNRINLIYDKTSWRPSFYVFYDNKKKWANSVEESIDLGIPSFISNRHQTWLKDKSNIEFYDYYKASDSDRKVAVANKHVDNVWSRDISEEICNFGGTHTVAAQICSYMGFDKLYFVGFDLYKPDNDHFILNSGPDPAQMEYPYDSTYNNIRYIIENCDKPIKSLINSFYYSKLYKNPKFPVGNKDQNHFDSQYHPEKTHKQKLNKMMVEGHKIIKIASKKFNFEVYNATIGGHLETYERRNFEKVIDE